MKQWIKKHPGWFVLCCIVLIIYIIFGITRYSEHTTFIPFTGRVLNISVTDYDEIFLHSGKTGEEIRYSSAHEMQEMIDRLNGFRYIFWIPKNPFPVGGWTYRVGMGYSDGTSESYYFGRNWLEVRGVRYFSAGDYFSEWAEALDNAG